MAQPRVLVIKTQPYLAQFLTEELNGFHFVFASPSEATVTLSDRLFELVVLTTDVGADDITDIQQCTDKRNIKTIIVVHPHGASDNVHPVQPMPTSSKEFANLLLVALANG